MIEVATSPDRIPRAAPAATETPAPKAAAAEAKPRLDLVPLHARRVGREAVRGLMVVIAVDHDYEEVRVCDHGVTTCQTCRDRARVVQPTTDVEGIVVVEKAHVGGLADGLGPSSGSFCVKSVMGGASLQAISSSRPSMSMPALILTARAPGAAEWGTGVRASAGPSASALVLSDPCAERTEGIRSTVDTRRHRAPTGEICMFPISISGLVDVLDRRAGCAGLLISVEAGLFS